VIRKKYNNEEENGKRKTDNLETSRTIIYIYLDTFV